MDFLFDCPVNLEMRLAVAHVPIKRENAKPSGFSNALLSLIKINP